MGKAELAAHLFRITQTDEKIKNENLSGQPQLEQAAFDVGKTVRATVIGLSGTRPEDMPAAEHIHSVRKKIKSASKQLKALDAPKAPVKKRLPPPAR
jgi:DNA-damage-inducible protein D